jgi:hypothetical protein
VRGQLAADNVGLSFPSYFGIIGGEERAQCCMYALAGFTTQAAQSSTAVALLTAMFRTVSLS